jgi:hypothetical protein
MNRLYLCAGVLLAALGAVSWLLSTGAAGGWVLACLMIAVAAYLASIYHSSQIPWQQTRRLIVGVAIAGRLIMFLSPFVLSDDVYRYYWDGAIQQHGWNPYLYPPSAPELAPLRDDIWEKSAHRDVPTMYPPMMLRVCHAGSVLASGPWIFKLIFTGFDLLALWFILWLLRLRGLNPSRAIVWAWSPLVMVEFAGMGHGMSLAVAFFVAGLVLLEGLPDNRSTSCAKKHQIGAGVAFASAVLSHYLAAPLVMAVVCVRRLWHWKFWVAFLVPMLAFFAMYADAGKELVTGFIHFSARWRFNGSLFELMAWLQGREHEAREMFGMWVWYPWIKIVSAVALMSVIAWATWRRYDAVRASWWTAGTVLLLSPTVHPWYVTWMVALGCVRFRWSWILFSGLVMLSYAAKFTELATGTWQEAMWARWAAYVPLFLLILWEIRRIRFDRSEARN